MATSPTSTTPVDRAAATPTKSPPPDAPQSKPFLPERLSTPELDRTRTLIWGPDLKPEVFQRWSQGFVFSRDEPTALVQDAGGPCAVITPVQAFIVKNLFQSLNDEWRNGGEAASRAALVAALGDMLTLVASDGVVRLVVADEAMRTVDSPPDDRREAVVNGAETQENVEEKTDDRSETPLPRSSDSKSAGLPPKRSKRLSHQAFHDALGVVACPSRERLDEVLGELESRGDLRREFAVLAFLYSLVLTKGAEKVASEVEDPAEPLIDGVFGHGSQSLLNLQITGVAVSNVFDDERDLGGFKLQGVTAQAPVGFLSFLEHLRYCEVGWYLKNPQNPVWVLGSETHFTLLFSPETRLIIKDSPITTGRRAFAQLDPEGNGFISADLLKDLLTSLDLVSEPPEFVRIMKDKLDPEGLDIIVLNNFLREFFGDADYDSVNQIPKSFALYHYNGLKHSSVPNLVYSVCEAKIDEPGIIVTDATPIKMCLQTKWPTLEMDWTSGNPPSLN